MHSAYSSLPDLGPIAVSHRSRLEVVKRRLRIRHGFFDAWLYGFLENKEFDVEETVAKFYRRLEMEVNELAAYEITPYMQKSLRSGTIQEIGEDKQGRVVLYVCTRRDVPEARHRNEQRRNFDMFISHATRLRATNKRCQVVLLINQEGASVFRNMDMRLQADIALRIAKYYPGMVDKMYICNMGRALSTVAKPIFKRLPRIVADRIQIIDAGDRHQRVLGAVIDRHVLPEALGGTNPCDDEMHWCAYAERVETYFAELQQAITQRGLTVKEWELERLGVSPDVLASGPAVTDGGPPLDAWEALRAALPPALARFFLEELRRWRLAVEEAERDERYALLDCYADGWSGRRPSNVKVLETVVGPQNKGLPLPLWALYKMILAGVTGLHALYLLAALVFFAGLTAAVLVTVFLACFIRVGYFLPLSCLLLMLMIQAASLCTRACDFLIALYQGCVLPLFERLGAYWGTVAEATLFSINAVVQFIIFVVYATERGPQHGLHVAFTTGWMSVALLIAVTHVLFFTGLFTAPSRQRPSDRLVALPFFLALNMSSDGEDADSGFFVRMSSFVLCAVPMGMSLLLGIAFVLSRVPSIYAATVVMALLAAFVVNFYTEALSNTLSASFMRLTLWMATLVWLYVTFALGFQNYHRQWAATAAVAFAISSTFVVLACVCLERRGSSWVLRVAFLLLLLCFLGGSIALFPEVHWTLGLLGMALMVHNALNVILAPHALTTIHGVFCSAAAVLLLLLSIVLIGWGGVTWKYRTPQSLPSVAPPASTASMLERYHRYPVCTLTMGSDQSLRVVDLALLVEVVMAYTPEVRAVDLARWFGGRGITYEGVVRDFSSIRATWQVHQFTDVPAHTTVLVLTDPSVWSSIMGIAGWVDDLALSPLLALMPMEWGETMVWVASAVSRLFSFTRQDLLTELTDFLQDMQLSAGMELLLCGSGISGGVLSAAAARTGTQAVVFSSPGLARMLRTFHLTPDAYHQYVLPVGPLSGLLQNIGGQDETMVQWTRCDGSAWDCISPLHTSYNLLATCGDPHGRQHVQLH